MTYNDKEWEAGWKEWSRNQPTSTTHIPTYHVVEVVTPLHQEDFFSLIAEKNIFFDHVCLNLIHWGYKEVFKFLEKISCAIKSKIYVPPISVHGRYGVLTEEQVKAIEYKNGIWVYTTSENDTGCDPATICREYFDKNSEITSIERRRRALCRIGHYKHWNIELYRGMNPKKNTPISLVHVRHSRHSPDQHAIDQMSSEGGFVRGID